MRILYVEDDLRDADLVTRQLRKDVPHFQVEIAGTLGEAFARLERFDAQPVDLVLTDMRLPDGSGLSLLGEVRSRALPVAIVVITGTGDEETAVTALKAGADDYIAKRQDYLVRLSLILENALHRYRAGATRRARPLRVLYAEHDPVDADLTRRHFEQQAAHIQLDFVHGGTELLQRFNQANGDRVCDVLLLDYKLPGLDALELLKELKLARKIATPVVLVTGKGSEDVVRHAMKLGAASYLVKNAGYLYQLAAEIENVSFLMELTRREEALQVSYERYELATAAGGVSVWDLDLKTGVVHADPLMPSFLTLQNTRPLNCEECLQRVHPDDRERVLETQRHVLDFAASEGGEANAGLPEISFRILDDHGATRWLLVRGNILRDGDGQPCRVLGTATDITTRKQSEESLRDALAQVERLKERLEAENVYLRAEVSRGHQRGDLLGQSKEVEKVLRQVNQVAPTDMTVLILGETGTGKELVARSVHAQSARRDRSLVKVDCAALPANLMESELFGHEKGAFTGATALQVGRFELADRGSIFLDEIGELPLSLQVKLLRVLQDGEFERLGSGRTIKVDVRVIAATNRNLSAAVQRGRFRADLYYRLNVYPIAVPPLRERGDDIGLLAEVFLEQAGRRLGKTFARIPRQVIEALKEYSWPGNVRELENVIGRAAVTSTGNTIQLPPDWNQVSPGETVSRAPIFATEAATSKGRNEGTASPLTLEELDRKRIYEVLRQTNWRIEGPKGAALILGLHANTLRARMRKLGIERPAREQK